MSENIIPIPDINAPQEIPNGYDLVIHEKSDEDAKDGCVLYGFDEVDFFARDYKNPTYSYVKHK